MDEKKRKILLVAGAVVALILLVVIILLIAGGDDEAPEPEALPVVEEALTPESVPAVPEPEKIERLSSYTVRERTTLQNIAAREDVYEDATKWWVLFAANPASVRYLFKTSSGGWVAIVNQGSTLTIPEPREVPATEKAKLQRGFNAFAVQFGSYAEQGNATSLLSRLREGEATMDFYESPLTVDGIAYIRVRAGLFSRWDDAEQYGQRIDARYDEVKDYYVVAVPSRGGLSLAQREPRVRARRVRLRGGNDRPLCNGGIQAALRADGTGLGIARSAPRQLSPC